MNYFFSIRFYDKSFRIITPEQANAIQKAYDADAKYVHLNGDLIALSSIARIESAKYLAAEMEDKFSCFGYPHLSDRVCRSLLFLPLSEYHLNQQIDILNNENADSEEKIRSCENTLKNYEEISTKYKKDKEMANALRKDGKIKEAREIEPGWYLQTEEEAKESIEYAKELINKNSEFITFASNKKPLRVTPPSSASLPQEPLPSD